MEKERFKFDTFLWWKTLENWWDQPIADNRRTMQAQSLSIKVKLPTVSLPDKLNHLNHS